jgi:hypothetical protein
MARAPRCTVAIRSQAAASRHAVTTTTTWTIFRYDENVIILYNLLEGEK